MGRPTTLIFAVLLFAAIANAQFAPQPGMAVGQPYPNMYAPPAYNPMMPYQSYQPYQPAPPMFMPGYNNGFMTNPYMAPQQPSYTLPSYNYSLPAYDYRIPSFNSNSDPYSSSALSYEEEEERRERAEEREEEREERRERKKREREEEREERKREEREERRRERVNNWPPVPKSSEQAAEVEAAHDHDDHEAPAAAAKPVVVPAKPVAATESRGAAPAANPAPRTQSWWETNPAYQQYLKDRKAYEASQKARTDWPPKPKPVTTVPAPQKEIQSTTGKLEASADTCVDCGVKQGPLAQQVEQLVNTVKDPREVFVYSKPPPTKVSEGIRKVINTIYQSCDAYNTLLRPDYCQDGFIGQNYCGKNHPREAGDLTAYKNPKEFFSYKVASQPGSNVMTPIKPEGPQCRDMNKTPPVFRVSTSEQPGVGRPKITKDSAGKVKLSLFNEEKTGGKFVTMDCSGFVSAAFTAAGLNFVPNSPTSQVTTKSLRDGTASCLSTVSFSASESIKSGDVAVFAGESQHSMIFDRVGRDPFGISDIEATPAGTTPAIHCRNNLKPSKFDFVIAQSGLYGGRTAVSQARAVDYVVNFGNGMMDGINAQIMQLAEDACVSKLTGTAREADRPGAAKLLRHKGSAAPGCVQKSPPELAGQACVKGCT